MSTNFDEFSRNSEFTDFLAKLPRMTLLYSFGHCGSYSLFTKKFGSLNDCMAICDEDTVRIDGGTYEKNRIKMTEFFFY